MAIRTISSETCTARCASGEDDLAKAEQAGVQHGALIASGAKLLRAAPEADHSPHQLRGVQSRAPFYKVMPASTSFAVQPEAIAPARRGYALSTSGPTAVASKASPLVTASAAAKTTAAKTTSTAKSTTSKELAFLDDKHLSIEDKLFQFMMLMTRKSDQELVDAMKSYEAKKATAQSKSSSSSGKSSSSGGTKSSSGGGGLFGFLGDALGGIGKAVLGGAESLAKDLGGPVLAGVATAVGMPFLAPVALKIGGDLGAGLVRGVASAVGFGGGSGSPIATVASEILDSSSATRSGVSSALTSSSSSKAATSKTAVADDSAEFDEKVEMFKLQRLVEKQSVMFSALTNAMKAMHNCQMTAVQNIR